jgi:antitoxin component YwqK of YwqJK toxin-antitoxin module
MESEESQEHTCYICLDVESEDNLFIKDACKCKGSINVHKICIESEFLTSTRKSHKCGICKSLCKLNGDFTKIIYDGQKKENFTLVNGKIEGLRKIYNLIPEEYLEVECSYVNNKKLGPTTSYYSNGDICAVTNFGVPNMPKSYNKMCGIHREYYSNGKLNFEQTYGTTPNTYGKLYGPFKNYNTSGILISEGIYEDGLISGYFKEYYDNGAIRCETYYRNGKISGPMTTYYENGNIHIKSTHTHEDDFSYENNHIGKYEEYKIDGTLSLSCNYNDYYQLDGEYKLYYNENDQLWKHFHFKDGKLHGEYKKYNPDGLIYISATYDNGNMVNECIKYYRTGEIFSRENYVLGQKSGLAVYYEKDGSIKSEINY